MTIRKPMHITKRIADVANMKPAVGKLGQPTEKPSGKPPVK